MKLYISILLSLFFLVSCSPKKIVDGWDRSKNDNHAILKYQLNDSLFQATDGRYVRKSDRIIKTKKEAYELAKPVLLKKYDKDYVEGLQYSVHFVNGFWIVRGMLPTGYTGGMLAAIIDSESGELLYTLVWK